MKKAIIIGAGPAGLTAAYQLLVTGSGIRPVIYEQSGDIGGISKTVNYKGNRMDVGGHRFFSKSDRVMNWWLSILPLEKGAAENFSINYHNRSQVISKDNYRTADPAAEDKVMLVRNRLSRIYYLRHFFDYPIRMNGVTFSNLGIRKIVAILASYSKTKMSPSRDEITLEDFFINRFGKVLYETFFKDYTEKVWGKSCRDIPAEWGAQRIKEMSVLKAIAHALKRRFRSDRSLSQKNTSTSLIEHFLYPKYGPGQMWEEVARRVQEMGGELHLQQGVKGMKVDQGKAISVTVSNTITGESTVAEGDYFFSTMPVQDLVAGIEGDVPEPVKEVAAGLEYRDFITVGLLLDKLVIHDPKTKGLIRDNWIYIQEKEVKLGRIQVFNNWSPYLVADPDKVWLGLEYFCYKGDELWQMDDAAFIDFAAGELEQIGMIDRKDVRDGTVVRMEKTYPAYFGTYHRFAEIMAYTDSISNLYLIGRNGMHKYNNSDHSMLTAMVAVDNLVSGAEGKENIWSINTEMEYHEEK